LTDHARIDTLIWLDVKVRFLEGRHYVRARRFNQTGETGERSSGT
jgi:hypothetical protein